MNFDLSDEQRLLREAARGALARHKPLEAAHELLDGNSAPDLWETAREAGWPGLVVSEEAGGAGLGGMDAMLVAIEAGRVLARVPLIGHVPATAILEAGGADGELLGKVASGELRATWTPARPPGDLVEEWTLEPASGKRRAPLVEATVDGTSATLSGSAHWVLDLPGADVVVVIADGGDGPIAVAVETATSGVSIEVDEDSYDPTRLIGHLTLDGAQGTVLGADADAIADAWYLAQGLLAGESLGAVETALAVSTQYAKERFTFGRPIGSYQAIKHGIVEILRRQENARSLIYYAGWARGQAPEEFPIAASAARVSAGSALDHASREMINVHGGIGATWEHDAPLFFRRAQVSRRLLGGLGDATDRIAGELLTQAAA
jgi:alkylation response protein AidB-like acyl-CoA dehydrogenase